MERLHAYLHEHAEGDLLPWRCQVAAAEQFHLSLAAVEDVVLEMGLLPARYQRNRHAFTTAEQLQLFRSRVAVIGCGGLGGYVIEELARLGVGEIIAVDPDVFVEHNLNRQLLASPGVLGCAKVEVAQQRVEKINPAVTLIPLARALTRTNGLDILDNARVAVDALDSVTARLDLAEVCEELAIPFVHGAIGGWYGQVATQFPGERTVQQIFANRENGQGAERHLGNPSFTPAVVASLEVAEVCKILLGVGNLLRNRKLSLDLLSMEIEEIPFMQSGGEDT
ncbi:MAG TPA: HesA/MoeB/ThiF family protein [Geobacteraceae bacterium]|nr:HesA/MoeB/ThiF family protein [Geobacteraceae bacterium]